MSKYDDATAHPLQRRDPEGARGLDAANGQDVLSEMERELAHELRWRRRLCRVVTLGHHLWGKRWRVDVGPAGFVESDATLLGWSKQCRVCYEVVDA